MMLAMLTLGLFGHPTDTMVKVDTVYLFSLPEHISNQGSTVVNLQAGQSLGNSLANTAFFTKNYGPSGISTLGLRGTQATQTQVIWHGIPINSPMLGQTDLQTISSHPRDQISLNQSANASTLGSGAIGGSINISRNVEFNQGYKQSTWLGAGNLGAYQAGSQHNYSWKNTMIGAGASWSTIENNYPIKINGESQKLNNASVNQSGFNFNIAHRFNSNAMLRSIAEFSHTLRELPKFANNITYDLLDFKSRRLMAEGLFSHKKLSHGFTAGYVQELYSFQMPLRQADHSQSSLFHIKYWAKRQIATNLQAEIIAEYGYNKGQSAGYIGQSYQNQKLPAAVASFTFSPKKWVLNAQNRYDMAANKNIARLSAETSIIGHRLYVNAGNTFRRPTLNELYWQSVSARDIKSETGLFAELGFGLKKKFYSINISGFARKMANEIIWIPNQNSTIPVNLSQSHTEGISIQGNAKQKIGNLLFELNTQQEIVNTLSRNNVSNEWNQTIFIPAYNQYSGLSATYKKLLISTGIKYTSFTYTNQENTEVLDGFYLINIQAQYTYKKWQIEGDINNVTNQIYYIIPSQQMPTRQMNIKLKYTL
jgi:iron complex outermembrane receptor protein